MVGRRVRGKEAEMWEEQTRGTADDDDAGTGYVGLLVDSRGHGLA